MGLDLLYAGLGLVILLLAGDSLVKGAVNLSLRVGIPALIVSLTIVAFGTSAPELLIAIQAALENAPGIALGNVVGSNTANVLLVLGVPALMATLHTAECDTRRTYIFMLLAGVSLVLGDAFLAARAHRNEARNGMAEAAPEPAEGDSAEETEDSEIEGADPSLPWWKILTFMLLGLIGLPLGASLLVESSVNIARVIGVSETVIGLTLVALGTSLPELATTVMAALRRQADVALGNVIGSNIFNLLAIIGVASFVAEIPVPDEMLGFDLWVMLAASLLLAPFVFLRWSINRVWGIVFTALYAVYVISVLI